MPGTAVVDLGEIIYMPDRRTAQSDITATGGGDLTGPERRKTRFNGTGEVQTLHAVLSRGAVAVAFGMLALTHKQMEQHYAYQRGSDDTEIIQIMAREKFFSADIAHHCQIHQQQQRDICRFFHGL